MTERLDKGKRLMFHEIAGSAACIFIGLAAGILVSGGMFALITTLGIINRFAQKTHTASHTIFYEECVIWGGTLGNILFIFDINLPFGTFGCIFFGIMGGIYAGCLAIALAEVIKTIPVFIMRTGVTKGFGVLIMLMAIGKSIGGLVYFFLFGYRV